MEPLVAMTPAVGGTPPAKPVATTPRKEERADTESSQMKLPKGQLSAEQVKKTVDELNDAMEQVGTSLTFSVDKDTGRTVVKVVDRKTGEIVRQIPSEEMVRLSQRIAQLMGVLFDDEA